MSRDAYVEKLKAQIDEWNARLDLWEAKARKATAEAKITCDRHLTEVRRKRDAAQNKLDEVKTSSGQAWEALKEGVEKAFGELKHSMEKAASQFE